MKLYIIDGDGARGHPEPGLFQQSLGWLDENGNAIRYQTLYHHAFPTPRAAVEGRGKAQDQDGAGEEGSRSVRSVRLGRT